MTRPACVPTWHAQLPVAVVEASDRVVHVNRAADADGRLRYRGRARSCSASLAPGQLASYEQLQRQRHMTRSWHMLSTSTSTSESSWTSKITDDHKPHLGNEISQVPLFTLPTFKRSDLAS